MEVIPGIDLLDDKCVCAVHASFAEDRPATHDPGEVARIWAEQGAARLYLADLDGARMGSPQNMKAIKEIIRSSGIPVDLGGGIRTVDTAKHMLDMGVDRVVIGTTAALEDKLATEMFEALGDKVVVSVASLNGYVAVRDWQARTDEPTECFISRMINLGAKRIVFTDVSRKGMHGGVNIIAVKRILQSVDVPVIASGGVSSLDDIRELKAIEHLGLEGVVVVTALYSGTIKLSDAIQIARSSN